MAAPRQYHSGASLAIRSDQPLIGIVVVENGHEVTRYFADETEVDAAVAGDEQTVADAKALAGAWSDLDWEEMVEELDRIRHANPPTPPIDEP